MIKWLIARIFGLKLVYVKFGYGHVLRFVRKDMAGREYVMCYGMVCHLDTWRGVVRIN